MLFVSPLRSLLLAHSHAKQHAHAGMYKFAVLDPLAPCTHLCLFQSRQQALTYSPKCADARPSFLTCVCASSLHDSSAATDRSPLYYTCMYPALLLAALACSPSVPLVCSVCHTCTRLFWADRFCCGAISKADIVSSYCYCQGSFARLSTEVCPGRNLQA